MPPITAPTPFPTDRKLSALTYLEAHGISASSPPSIRASQLDCADNNEFIYFLVCRLGLVPALSYSAALSRGTYFHYRFALMGKPNAHATYDALCAARLDELKATCKALNISGEATEGIINREIEDQLLATIYYDAATTVKLPGTDNRPTHSFEEYMLREGWRIVGSEIRIALTIPKLSPTIPLVCQLDLLLLHEKTATLWIPDAKTTSYSPRMRAATISYEFATQFYMLLVQEALDRQVLQSQLNLPEHTHLAGMLHPIVQKPTIRMSAQDRDFKWVSDGARKKMRGTLRRAPSTASHEWMAEWAPYDYTLGPAQFNHYDTFDNCFAVLHEATGKTPEKAYFGDPRRENFLARCRQWYTDEVSANPGDPPVNISRTPASLLRDPHYLSTTHQRIERLVDLASRTPYPENFYVPNERSLLGISGNLNPYAPFILKPIRDWPDVIKQDNFMVCHRDEQDTLADSVVIKHINP